MPERTRRTSRFDPQPHAGLRRRLDRRMRRHEREASQSEGLVAGAAGGAAGGVQRRDPADDGGQLLGAGDLRQQRVLLRGRAVVRGGAATRSVFTTRCCASCSSPASSWSSRCRSAWPSRWRCRARASWVSVCLVLMALPLLIPWNVVGAMWNIFALPDIGLLGRVAQRAGLRLQLHPPAAGRLVHADRDGRLALDLAGGAARLCRPVGDSRRLLPGGEDRRRLRAGRCSATSSCRR